jgi:hypothetical protein
MVQRNTSEPGEVAIPQGLYDWLGEATNEVDVIATLTRSFYDGLRETFSDEQSFKLVEMWFYHSFCTRKDE